MYIPKRDKKIFPIVCYDSLHKSPTIYLHEHFNELDGGGGNIVFRFNIYKFYIMYLYFCGN